MANVLILTNACRQVVTNMLHVQMHQGNRFLYQDIDECTLNLCPKKSECFNNQVLSHANENPDTSCIVI